jgi:membrane protease YdiL (CAAX protease family)
MIAIADGMPGIREFLARLRRWRVGAGWYALALIPALSITATTLLLSLISAELRPAIFAAENRSAILIAAIGASLLVGSFEEIGWTGFAVPHLRLRHSILSTGLAVGVVWGTWHFPLFWEADSLYATLPFTILLTRLYAWLPPFRVLLISIHERTRSLPVVMLMHSAVSFVSIVFAPQALSGARLLTSPLAAAATMWLLVAVVGIASRRRFAGQALKPIAT